MNGLLALTRLYLFQIVRDQRLRITLKYCLKSSLPLNYKCYGYSDCYYLFVFIFSSIDSFPQLLHLSEGVIRNIQKRFVRDRDAWKRVLQSFGIIEPKRAKKKAFPDIFRVFLETPVNRLNTP